MSAARRAALRAVRRADLWVPQWERTSAAMSAALRAARRADLWVQQKG
jgi:hypothetical protein